MSANDYDTNFQNSRTDLHAQTVQTANDPGSPIRSEIKSMTNYQKRQIYNKRQHLKMKSEIDATQTKIQNVTSNYFHFESISITRLCNLPNSGSSFLQNFISRFQTEQ